MARGSVEQLPSGRWRVRWYTRDGRHPSRTFTLKRDAEVFLRRAIVDSERAGSDIAPQDETLQTLIKVWWPSVERSVKPRTADRYREHLRTIEAHPLAREPIQRVDYAATQAFIDDLSARYAPKTVGGIYGVLALVLKDAAKRGKVTRAVPKPVMPRPRKAELVIPTRDEVLELAEASDARLTVPVLLAGFCGLRQGELLALQRADVDLVRATVFVHQARNKASGAIESTKTDAARVVHLPHRVAKSLVEHMDEHDGPLICPVTASVFDKSWRHARTTCGLTRVRFHDLRHAAASIMIHAGWNINQVSKQLGHANATMTLNVYAHLWPDSFDEAIAKLDTYLGHDSA
jgi:integrase